MGIEVRFDDTLVNLRTINFSGGEVHPRIVDAPTSAKVVRIVSHAYSSDDIMELALVVDAVNEWLKRYMQPGGAAHKMHLEMPYLPYARQDRVCHPGEANGLRVMCRMLDKMDFDRIKFWDVHNPLATMRSMQTNSINETADHFVKLIDGLIDPVVIAPDKGAVERATLAANALHTNFYCATKLRSSNNGAILATQINMPHQEHRDLLMVDDICDGGRTFIALAEVLCAKTDGRVLLYVTHGIFSRGLDVFDGLIDQIYCPNVFPGVGEHSLLTRI